MPFILSLMWFWICLPWKIFRECLIAIPRFVLYDVSAPKAVCPVTPRNKEILDLLTFTTRPYIPTPWLVNGSLQTLFAMLRSPREATVTREVLKIPTSLGSIVLDWMGEANSDRPHSARSTTPIVLVCPGTTGRSDEPIVRTLARELVAVGWRVAVSNRPGATGGYPDDVPDIHGVYELGEVVEYIHGLYPSAPIFGIGIAIGSNALCRYLAQAGQHSRLQGVVVVSPIFDVRQHSKRLSQNPFWDLWTSWQLRGVFYETRTNMQQYQALDHHRIRKSSSMQELDNAFSRRVTGHGDLEDFYRKLRTNHLLRDVAVPLLVLHSSDDPLVPLAALPVSELRGNCNVISVTTRRGGHAAFCCGLLGDHTLVTAVASEFFGAIQRTTPAERDLETASSEGRLSNSFRGTPTQSFEQWNATTKAQYKDRRNRLSSQITKHGSLKF